MTEAELKAQTKQITEQADILQNAITTFQLKIERLKVWENQLKRREEILLKRNFTLSNKEKGLIKREMILNDSESNLKTSQDL